MLSVGGPFNYEGFRSREWLVANGLGGYASSTVTGANTRKYHGLLVASKNPPVERRLLVSKLEETVRVGGKEYPLSTNKYQGAVYPRGFENLSSFSLFPLPSFEFTAGDARIKKTVFMVQGKNATIVRYEVDSHSPAEISIAPLVNDRDFHGNTNSRIGFSQVAGRNGTVVMNEGRIAVTLESDMLAFSRDEAWYDNMLYEIEVERGENGLDSHFRPGFFQSRISGGRHFHITMTDGSGIAARPEALYQAELARVSRLRLGNAKVPEGLLRSADTFRVLRKSTSSSSIIAGYHWFADWGRDSMISLPGLALETGEVHFARSVLETFAKHVRNGLVPNVFSDSGGGASYNSADASLWFIISAYKYAKKSGDFAFVKEKLWGRIKEIIGAYARGTEGVRMDSDSLITCGPGLTWMDAKVGERFMTPRAGKPVEVNALWINALEIESALAEEFGENALASDSEILASKARMGFSKFWNEKNGYLLDGVDGNDPAVRPNAVIAISLPFRVLDEKREKKVLGVAGKELLTPYGLRSLSQKESGFVARYSGNREERDSAYHNGAVWSWLIGPYADACARVLGKSEAGRLVKPLKEFITEKDMGTVPELFDAGSLEPRGCFSQAWGVAEWLRVISEYG